MSLRPASQSAQSLRFCGFDLRPATPCPLIGPARPKYQRPKTCIRYPNNATKKWFISAIDLAARVPSLLYFDTQTTKLDGETVLEITDELYPASKLLEKFVLDSYKTLNEREFFKETDNLGRLLLSLIHI